jgi:hypothetical protein
MSHPNNCAVAEFQRRVEAYADRMALPIENDDLAWIQAAKAVRDEVDLPAPDTARIWVAVDAFDPTQILTLPLGTRAEVQWWLDQQYDDVDGFPKVITVGEYRASGGNGQYEAQIASAAREFRLTPAEADAAHAHSCTCGDRAGHEAEDGSDYSIPRDDNEVEVA